MRLLERAPIIGGRPCRFPVHIAVIVRRVNGLHRISEDTEMRVADLTQQLCRFMLMNAGVLMLIQHDDRVVGGDGACYRWCSAKQFRCLFAQL